MFEALSFAGGGNRCYWQGGFYETVAPRLGLKPKLVVGVSGGAFASLYTALGLGPEIRPKIFAASSVELPDFDWAGWVKGQPLCPVGELYEELLRQTFDAARLAALKDGTTRLISIARPPRGWPVKLAAAIGLAAYQTEKKVSQPVHPVMGRRLGFRPEFIAVNSCATPADLIRLLMASATVPPFMPVQQINGAPALDGGMVDNVPVDPLLPIEAAGGRTLVLLTRPYEKVPQVTGRTYVQPSQVIPVGQFTINNPEGIRTGYRLGVRDGETFLRGYERLTRFA
jgi:Patatin-like phospholipase